MTHFAYPATNLILAKCPRPEFPTPSNQPNEHDMSDDEADKLGNFA